MTKLVMPAGDRVLPARIDLSKFDLTPLHTMSPVNTGVEAKYEFGSILFRSSVTLSGTNIEYSYANATYISGAFSKIELVVADLVTIVATFTDVGFNADDVNLLLTSKSAGLARLLAGNDVILGGDGNDVLLGLEGRDELRGREGNDRIDGGAGADLLDGQGGHDRIYGGAASDKLYGRYGNDYLDGGTAGDIMDGGDGNDRYVIDNRLDRVLERDWQFDKSLDVIVSETISIDLAKFANVEGATLVGGRDLRLGGSADRDYLIGNEGNNAVSGRGGNDAMRGNDGNDTMNGGAGQDVMTGGLGRDTFLYKNWRESVAYTADKIKDFKHGEDRIDLRSVDANSVSAGNAAFHFLSTKGTEFSGQAGELRWRHQGTTTIIEGDVNGDRTADLVIHLNGKIVLSAGDFVL